MLEVSSDVDELPTEADAVLEADDVLSASAGSAVRPIASVVANVVAMDREVARGYCMGLPEKGW